MTAVKNKKTEVETKTTILQGSEKNAIAVIEKITKAALLRGVFQDLESAVTVRDSILIMKQLIARAEAEDKKHE